MTTGNDNGFAARRGPFGTRPGGGPVPGYGKHVPAGKRVSAEGNRSGCNGGDDVFLRALSDGFDGPALGHDAPLVCVRKRFQGNSAVGGFPRAFGGNGSSPKVSKGACGVPVACGVRARSVSNGEADRRGSSSAVSGIGGSRRRSERLPPPWMVSGHGGTGAGEASVVMIIAPA